MAVITVSREIGSQGSVIAHKAADALGYHVVDKDLMEEVFLLYGLPEFRKVYDEVPGPGGRVDWARPPTVDLLNRLILALAQHGNTVIIGRGSFAVLRGFADVLNVRIQAPVALRVQRFMADSSITDLEEATALVEELDRARAAFVESTYGVRWRDTGAFDLVLDTGKLTPDVAANRLVAAVRELSRSQAGTQATTATIQVDRTLASVICDVLHCQSAHG